MTFNDLWGNTSFDKNNLCLFNVSIRIDFHQNIFTNEELFLKTRTDVQTDVWRFFVRCKKELKFFNTKIDLNFLKLISNKV